MNHLTLFESYKLSLAKQLTKAWKDSGADKLYDNLFGENVFRLYLPLGDAQTEAEDGHGAVYYAALKALEDNGYAIVDYRAGTASKVGDTKNVFKIGKLLQRFDPVTKGKFDADPDREGSKLHASNLLVCISRHAYDIGGMSTGRGWTSCMNFKTTGINNSKYVKHDIAKGSLVAYLINKDDKNINAPIARLLIKPHTSTEGTALYPEEKVYGTDFVGFRTGVVQWLNSIQPAINAGNKLTKYRVAKGLYNDRKEPVIPVTHIGNYEVVKQLAGSYYLITQPDSDKKGIYDLKLKKVIIPVRYDKITRDYTKCFFGHTRKYVNTETTYTGTLYAPDGTVLLTGDYYHTGSWLVSGKEYVYVHNNDGTEIYEYLAKEKRVNKILTFDGHMGISLNTRLFVGRRDEKMSFFDATTRTLYNSPLKDRHPWLFLNDSKSKTVFVGNGIHWYCLGIKKVIMALKNMETTYQEMSKLSDTNRVMRFHADNGTQLDVNVDTGETTAV